MGKVKTQLDLVAEAYKELEEMVGAKRSLRPIIPALWTLRDELIKLGVDIQD
jgi:hypothetical protein